MERLLLGVAVDQPHPDDGSPDRAYEAGASALALIGEHLDLGDGTDDELLLDIDLAAQTVRYRAADLDSWHAGGRCRAPTRPAARHDRPMPTQTAAPLAHERAAAGYGGSPTMTSGAHRHER